MRVVFLDRDGVINQYPGDTNYVKNWGEFKFIPGSIEGMKKLNACGFKLCVVSNQAGVSKGVYTQENLDEINENMLKEFKAQGIEVEGVYYCTHLKSDNCDCRKPKTGLLKQAILNLGGTFEISFLIFGLTIGIISFIFCLLYTSPSPRDGLLSRMPSSA